MDEDIEKPEPKISIVVGLLVEFVCVVMDALSLIPVVGDIEEIPALLGLILSVVFGLGSATIALEALVDVLKAIPFVQELPLWFIAWPIVWYMENHPSPVTKPIQQVLNVAGALEGDVGELGEAGLAAESVATEVGGAAEETGIAVVDTGEGATSSVDEFAQQRRASSSLETEGEAITEAGEEEQYGGEGGGDGERMAPDEESEKKISKDVMANENEGEPMENLQTQLTQPSDNDFAQKPSDSEEDEEDDKAA